MNKPDKEVLNLLENSIFRSWVLDADEEALRNWNNYLEKNPVKPELISEARNILLGLDTEKPSFSSTEKSMMWSVIKQSIDQPTPKSISKSKSYQLSRRQTLYMIGAAAASIIGTLLVFNLFFIEARYQEVFTGNAEVKTLQLPDNSTVYLNANSSIKYSESLDQLGTREVWLEGEAFLEVSKNKTRFIVHSASMDVEVLGTKFNVYDRKGKGAVVLNEGKVKVLKANSSSKEALYLEPGEMINLQEDIFQKQITNPERFNSWIQKEITLDKTTILQLAETLEDFYGLEVVLDDQQLGERAFSSTTTLSLEDIDLLTQVIEELFQVKIYQTEKQLIIKNHKKG